MFRILIRKDKLIVIIKVFQVSIFSIKKAKIKAKNGSKAAFLNDSNLLSII